MRYRVDTEYGYISFDESDKKKAYDYYEDASNNAVRILKCEDIFDRGTVLNGAPLISDLTVQYGTN